MNTMTQTFRLTALAAALMAVYGMALAEDNGLAELTKPDSSVSLGLGNWTKDRPQQGIYDGMREMGAYGLIDADVVKRNDDTGTWMTLKARNLGIENREIRGEYLRQGDVGVSLEYSRIPRDNPNTFTTRLQGIGDTTQIVSNSTTTPFRTVNLGTTRDATKLNFYKSLAPNLDFKLSFRHEEKSGERQWGRGSAAEFAVEPIDSTIRQLDGVLNYTTEKLQLSGGYSGSWYNNQHNLVTVFTGRLNNAPTYLSQPLDNQAHRLFLNGGYNFTPTTRATVKLAYARATQDEHLPTKDIAGLSLAGSPSSLDGEVNTTLAQVALTSRPLKNLSLLASIRYLNVEDETPVNRFVQTNAACASGQCVDNTPFSYKTLTSKLEGTYRLTDQYSLNAGVEERRQDRHVPVSNANGVGGTDTQRVVPMRSEVDETTLRMELRRLLSEVLTGSVGYLVSDRTGSNYTFAAGPGNGSSNGFTNISNLINPINIADRERRKVRLGLDWTPLQALSVQLIAEDGRDNYDRDSDRPFGLDEGTTRLFSLDASYTLSKAWQVNAWYSYDHSEAKQFAARAANAGGGAAIKRYKLEDTGDTLGVGLRGDVTPRLKFGADLQWTRTLSKYDQQINRLAGGAVLPANFSGNLPDIENKLIRLSVFSTYAVDKHSDVRVDLIHERWRTDDWTWMFADGTPFTYGTTTDGTTVTAKARQTANFAGVRYIFKFQ
ncbi:MtrB/PioB family decaheme-associated outer membrane protein [Aromatoleum toluclasticum]|uniref:MtrB/PioB family decaheme-associated outer membrane protein n=1 Tax=Aromatoleum toluclasticum TaxID=92003 RepID=UPI001D17F9E3|nr:MtrB/PioB family decaheme-associated outer membrane protein [Aromatoleum toluclasticum]MCC4115755.1 MtrB/PioB family decaheme-associated outer membrane protein [Aromatoleum toluclasticum]